MAERKEATIQGLMKARCIQSMSKVSKMSDFDFGSALTVSSVQHRDAANAVHVILATSGNVEASAAKCSAAKCSAAKAHRHASFVMQYRSCFGKGPVYRNVLREELSTLSGCGEVC